jgi:hypothetical protein
MSHEKIDAAKQAPPALFMPAFHDMEDYDPMNIGGPGGQTINSENNEKGILESGLQRVISRHQQAMLGSNHDSFKQGIYTTNSVGDND